MSQGANYSGRQPNSTAYIKLFYGSSRSTANWTNIKYNGANVLAPDNKNSDVYVYKGLIVGGSILTPSDSSLKINVQDISLSIANELLEVIPKQYTFKKDIDEKLHYGFIAQELEKIVPSLVEEIDTPINGKIKSVNYVEMIPLLLLKIKDLQTQIDNLKTRIIE